MQEPLHQPHSGLIPGVSFPHPGLSCPSHSVLLVGQVDGAKSSGIISAGGPGEGRRLVQLTQLVALEKVGWGSGTSGPYVQCNPAGLGYCLPSLWPRICAHGKEKGRHQPFPSHEGQIQCASHDCPCSYCLSLQTYLQFNGELSKQSERINGKYACMPLA